MSHRYFAQWATHDGLLRAEQPTPAELAACSTQLSADYNEPHNSTMMANEQLMSPQDVVDHWAGLEAQAALPFLLYRDGELMGDADLRHLDSGDAEFAIMVCARRAQGKGLGTRFAGMLHVLAFDELKLHHLFVAIIPSNAASRRLFEKLGYQADDTPRARRFAEDPTDLCMSVTRAPFESAWWSRSQDTKAITLGMR